MQMKRMMTVAALSLLAATGAQLGAAAPASAHLKGWAAPEVSYVKGNVFADGDAASVRAKYRCAPETEMTHLWVSVKQGGDGDLTAEGSGATAKAWYDTNMVEGEPEVVCDGRWQTVDVPIAKHAHKSQLERGEAYVQFCLYTMKGEDMQFASVNRWSTVKP